ncbi:MAG: MotA/TolQ/ExbB proton channel family protein [Spirochaetes bacterium]|nr:MotA/TolQ/ExbB proton channel family protein [Spirochaetota bacterium]
MQQGFFSLMQKGGFVMWPILAAAIAAGAIIIERLLYFFFTSYNYPRFRDTLVSRIDQNPIESLDILTPPAGKDDDQPRGRYGRFLEGVAQGRWRRCSFVKVTGVYIDNLKKGARSREEAVKRAGSEELEGMERHLGMLSAIAQISTLLGLLGTVTGIIGSFAVISRMGGQVDVSSLAGGIWEALITTVAGLTVAIPTQLAHIYLDRKVSARANRMGYTITYLNERHYAEPEADCGGDSGDGGTGLRFNKEVVGEAV